MTLQPNPTEVVARLIQAVSKKVTAKRRRTARKDSRTIAMTRAFTLPDSVRTGDSLVANTTGAIRAVEIANLPPAWVHTTHLAKVTFANRVMFSAGAVAFTLNLAPDVIIAANENKLGFTNYMSRKLSRALKRCSNGSPLYWFGVHVTGKGRPHLHGAIIANNNDRSTVKAALKEVGGDWKAEAKQYQLRLRRMPDPDGWVRYVFRELPHARRRLPGKMIAITNPLRSAAARLYDAFRARLTGRREQLVSPGFDMATLATAARRSPESPNAYRATTLAH